MQLTILGSSPSFAAPDDASSGYLIDDDSFHLLVDCGHGILGILRSMIDLSRLNGIIISHMHPDHIFDLVPLRYAYFFERLPGVPLWLPPDGFGVLERLQSAVGLPDNFFTGTFQVQQYWPERSLDMGPLRITFAPTRHYISGYAMRFHSNGDSGRTLTYTADTGWTQPVVDLARDAHLALVEASVPEYHSEEDSYGHLTPDLAGQLAREAGVERLVITHYYHPARDLISRKAADAFGGPVLLAESRMTIPL
jgi:ribonuclease BN (tRNA processing enzyme)